MADASRARLRGDKYQILFCWLKLLSLRTSPDWVEAVEYECPDVRVVDDVVVTYFPGYRDGRSTQPLRHEYFQCKYHVNMAGAFSGDNLTSLGFVNTQETMLQRLYAAYQRLSAKSENIRLCVVSNWSWDHRDVMAKYIDAEGFIRPQFFERTARSRHGAMRVKLASYLGISEAELRPFLEVLRFQLGANLSVLRNDLNVELKMAQLKPLDPTRAITGYVELLEWMFLVGRSRFDAIQLDEVIRREGLIAVPSSPYSEISICSRAERARRPRDLQAAHLDLCELFEVRFPNAEGCWTDEVPRRLGAFLHSVILQELPPPIHLFFDCYLSLALAAGYLLHPKLGLQIIPAQKSPVKGYELWEMPPEAASELWKIEGPESVGAEEVVLSISVTHPIGRHLDDYLEHARLEGLPRITASPAAGVSRVAVRDGVHAWQLGWEIGRVLRDRIMPTCKVMHVFAAGPAALLYIIGNSLQGITPQIRLYEHDFDGELDGPRYYPSLCLPVGRSTEGE